MADRQAWGDRLRDGAHLAVLWAFACAQPLFNVLGGSDGEVFVVARWRGGDILIFALLLIALPPLLLWAIEQLIGIRWPEARRWLHLFLIGALITIGAAYVIKQYRPTVYRGLGVAPLIGLAGAVAYARFDAVRLALTYLSPAPLLFAGAFLLSNPIVPLVFPDAPMIASAKPVQRPPVVIVVFDELPTVSLMNRNGRLDSSSYPGFAMLARDSTWFRRATTVHTATVSAVPAILTGDYAPTDTPAAAAAYPKSIFTLLANSYRLAVEQFYPLCPASLCPNERPPPGVSRLVHLLPTIAKAGFDQFAPDRWVFHLPDVNAFAQTPMSPQEAFKTLEKSIRPDESPTLHFIHAVYPHVPWIHAEDGTRYPLPACCAADLVPDQMPAPQLGVPVFGTDVLARDPRAVVPFQQRHLAQLRDADFLLEGLLRKLKRSKLYGRAVIVVTADHGTAFDPGSRRRRLDPETNAGEIMGVPLFLKLPGQHAGRISDRHVRTIDVMPTIAHVLGMKLPWRVTGKTMVPEARFPEPRRLKVIDPLSSESFFIPVRQFDAQLFRATKRKDRNFGPATPGVQLYRDGPASRLIGSRVRQLRLGDASAGDVTIDELKDLRDVNKKSEIVPTLIGGVVAAASGMAIDSVAIAINGRVRTTAWTYPTNSGRHFQALIPPAAIRNGANHLSVFGLNSAHTGRGLTRLKSMSPPLP
jgi:hypothetical protein